MTRAFLATLFLTLLTAPVQSAEPQDSLRAAQSYYEAGQYFKSARYAFSSLEGGADVQSQAYSWITLSLVRAGLYNSASYFFIRTLQTGGQIPVRRVLTQTQDLLVHLGADLVRKYLIQHTKYEDYDAANRNAYLYSLGKEAILAGEDQKAVGYFDGIRASSPLYPYVLELRGSAYALLGQNDSALSDFRRCQGRAFDLTGAASGRWRTRMRREAEDLQARCTADEARTFYQMDRFDEADWAYDRIPKASLVWPDILFEQAWNAFARGEYNRALGKLVSYKSPALSFVFNPEIDVLRAQSYLALCLYADANDVINEFNSRYSPIGEQVQRFVETRSSDLPAFYELGRAALHQSIYSEHGVYPFLNRFIRGPYFQNLVASERELRFEREAIAQFDAAERGVQHGPGHGFPGFLDQVLAWRLKSIQLLGGSFIKNSMIDYHKDLIGNFDKMSFIKLEMLKRAKDLLMYKHELGLDRSRGNVEPERKDYQYRWSFNGEFWNDELGDYVFGLESECKT